MDKKKSLPLLKTKFKQIGLTAASLGALAENDTLVDLADDASEDEIQSALSAVEPFAKALQKAEDGARQAYIQKQQKEQGKDKDKDGGDPDTEPEKTGGEQNPEIKALLESVKALTQTVAEMKGANTAKSRKELLKKELEGLDESYATEQLENFDLFNFKDDEHFTTWLDGKKERFESLRQESTTRRAGDFGHHQRPAGDIGGNKPSSGMQAYLDSKGKAEKAVTGKDPFSTATA